MNRQKVADILLTALISSAIALLQGYLISLGHSAVPPPSIETAGITALGIRTALYIKYV